MVINDSRFHEAVEGVFIHEGGYVNNPNDLGRETKYGISKKAYPDLNIKDLTREQAKEIYYKDYWLPNKCWEIPSVIVSKYFDMCVNVGAMQATKILQRSLNAMCDLDVLGMKVRLDDDGILGDKTIRRVQKFFQPNVEYNKALVSVMRSELAGFYRVLVAKDPRNKVFLKGWLNRAYS